MAPRRNDEAGADIVHRHREELFYRQVIVSQIAHRRDEATIRSEFEIAHASAVFEQSIEENHAGFALERELHVRVGVRIEAGEILQREITAHLESAFPGVGIAIERQPEHGPSLRLSYLRRPIASDRLLSDQRRSGAAVREHAESGEYNYDCDNDQCLLHFCLLFPLDQRFSLTRILSAPVAFNSINSRTETFFSPSSLIFFT